MKKLLFGLLATSLFFMFSCSSGKTVKYVIASTKGDCVGVTPMKCMLIKRGNDTSWKFFYNEIEGFNYEEGYEYELEVSEEKVTHQPADASSIKLTLIKEVSKIKKESENLPESVVEAKQAKYRWTGTVLGLEAKSLGTGAAVGKFNVMVMEMEVTTTETDKFKVGDIIHAELIANPAIEPAKGREYVFKAREIHPAHALGVYTLDTEVMDLI